MSSRQYIAKGANALFASAFLYALTAVLIREVSPMWGDKAQIAARNAGAFLLVFLFVIYKKTNLRVRRKDLFYLISLGALFSFSVILFVVSVQRTSIANALFVFFGSSIIGTFIFGTLFLKEEVGMHKIVSLFFALFGLVFYSGDFNTNSSGVVLAAIAGMTMGLTNIILKLLKDLKTSVVQVYQFGVTALITSILMIISGEQIIKEVTLKVTLLTVLFTFVMLAAISLVIYGYRYFDVNIGAAISASEIVFGVILGYIIYKEIPSTSEFIGGTFIFIGAVIGSLDFSKMKSKYNFRFSI